MSVSNYSMSLPPTLVPEVERVELDSGCWIGLISLVGLRGWRIRLCPRVSTENRVRKFDKISDNGPEGNLG